MDRKRSIGRAAVLGVLMALGLVLGATSQAVADKDPCTFQCD